MTNNTPLSNEQLYTLLHSSPTLDRVALAVSPPLRTELLTLEIRAGNAQANISDDTPTTEQVRNVLGRAYLEMSGNQKELRNIMDAMALTPYAYRQPSFLKRATNSITGWFR